MKINTPYNTHDSLYHDSLSLVGISDTSQFPIVQFIRNANNWYRKASTWIRSASSTWEYDDSNWSNLPLATTTLVANQQDYALDVTVQEIERVEVLDSNGNYQRLTPFDQSQLTGEALSEFEETAGLPRYYDIRGNSLFLYPKPAAASVTTAAGLKIYFSRDISEFTVTSTSTEPGFNGDYHRLVSLGAAYDYCLSNGIEDRKNNIRTEIEQYRTDLQNQTALRDRDFRVKFIPKDNNQI